MGDINPAADARAMTMSVPLDLPLVRGEVSLERLTFRRPSSGDLRGLSLVQLGQMNVDELRKLLPRISTDGLIEQEVDSIDPADMMAIAGEIGDFLLPRRMRTA